MQPQPGGHGRLRPGRGDAAGGPGAPASSMKVSAIDEPHDAAEPREIPGVEVEASAADVGRYLGEVQVDVDPARVGHDAASPAADRGEQLRLRGAPASPDGSSAARSAAISRSVSRVGRLAELRARLPAADGLRPAGVRRPPAQARQRGILGSGACRGREGGPGCGAPIS